MGVEIYRDVDSIREEWDELADRARAMPWVRPGWIEAWWRAFGSGRLEIVALRRDGRLIALVPLARTGGVLRAPVNWHTPEFELVAESEDVRVELARAVLALRPRRVELRFVNDDSSTLAAMQTAARDAGLRTLVREMERSPYVRVTGDWASYASGRGKKVIKYVARRRRKLEAAGEPSFEIVDGGDRLADALEEGFAVEASGWKGERGTAIASRPETRGFYTDIARWAAERGWLRLAFVRLDGKAIAFLYGIEADGVFYDLKPGHLEDHSRFSPGKLIVEELVRYTFERGGTSFEFLGAADDYKLEWTSDVRVRLAFQAFASGPGGFVDWTANRFGRPLAKRVLQLARR